MKKELEEGFERVEKFFGKKLYLEQKLVLAYLYQNKDVILPARTGFGKSMLFFGFALMMPADASRFITIILTPLQGLGHHHSAELNELCNTRYQEEKDQKKAKQDKRAAEKKMPVMLPYPHVQPSLYPTIHLRNVLWLRVVIKDRRTALYQLPNGIIARARRPRQGNRGRREIPRNTGHHLRAHVIWMAPARHEIFGI